MEWSHDFCLSCDRQISQSDHGAYCSQSCRLADLERASNSSGSPSPSTSAPWNSHNCHGSGFYLPPALNFSSYGNKQTASSPPSPTSRCHISTTHQYPTTSQSYTGERSSHLYSSPSRSSLSSLHSSSQHSDPVALSDKIKSELRDYAGSFDHTRDWKRRMTVYWSISIKRTKNIQHSPTNSTMDNFLPFTGCHCS